MSGEDEVDGWTQFDVAGKEVKDLQDEHRIKALQIAQRFHRVFVQNDDGVELLESMMRSFVMVPIVSNDSTQFEAGIKAGRADVVHQIIANIKLAENPGGDNVQ